MILPNPDYPLPIADTLEPCTLLRLNGAAALRTAIVLLGRARRSGEEDERLLREAQAAVECLGLAGNDARSLPRLAAELVLVRALAATRRATQAEDHARRLWTRSAHQPGIQAELALVMAELVDRHGNPLAGRHWTRLAAGAVAAMDAAPARQRCADRLAALAART